MSEYKQTNQPFSLKQQCVTQSERLCDEVTKAILVLVFGHQLAGGNTKVVTLLL